MALRPRRDDFVRVVHSPFCDLLMTDCKSHRHNQKAVDVRTVLVADVLGYKLELRILHMIRRLHERVFPSRRPALVEACASAPLVVYGMGLGGLDIG